jgi:hypothetical protein
MGPTYRPGGWICVEGQSAKVEIDTFMCGHCNRHTIVKPGQRPEDVGGMCYCCTALLCPRCTGLKSLGQPCMPLEKWLDDYERQHSTAEAIEQRADIREERERKKLAALIAAEEASYHARRSYGL